MRDATGWVLIAIMATCGITLAALCWLDPAIASWQTRRARAAHAVQEATAAVEQAQIDDEAEQLTYDIAFVRITADLEERP